MQRVSGAGGGQGDGGDLIATIVLPPRTEGGGGVVVVCIYQCQHWPPWCVCAKKLFFPQPWHDNGDLLIAIPASPLKGAETEFPRLGSCNGPSWELFLRAIQVSGS